MRRTPNVYKAFINRDATHAQEAQQAQARLVGGEVRCADLRAVRSPRRRDRPPAPRRRLDPADVPAIVIGLYTRWFHRWALFAGWAVGMAYGTWLAYGERLATRAATSAGRWSTSPARDQGLHRPPRLLLNLLVAVVATLVLRGRSRCPPASTDPPGGLPRRHRRPGRRRGSWIRRHRRTPDRRPLTPCTGRHRGSALRRDREVHDR